MLSLSNPRIVAQDLTQNPDRVLERSITKDEVPHE